MKIVIAGANGLIGRAVAARLLQDGHEVVGTGRSVPPILPPGLTAWLRFDFRRPDPEAWAKALAGADAVVNCVGALQNGPGDDVSAAHAEGAAALFEACQGAGVRRVIHFSAVGVDRHQASAFSRTKQQGENELRSRDLDWVILRPSVVLGRQVFGASALFRGLSALPVLPLLPGTGLLQVVTLNDVAETVARLVKADAPSRIAVDLVGPERLSMAEIVASLRHWQGWKPARHVPVPQPLAKLVYRAGDALGALGWRVPMRSTVSREIVHGATSNRQDWEPLLARSPMSLAAWLQAHPPGVQDRWFARLYFAKPFLLAVLALFWIATGIISLTWGFEIGVGLMVAGGAGLLSVPSVVAGALADIVIGIAIAFRKTCWYGLWGAIGLSLFYAIAGTILLPELWREPLGPLLKIWPILVAHVAALAMLEER